MSDIKSSAAIKYSSSKVPERYSELATNTNINSPPEGWLLGRYAEKQPWKPGQGVPLNKQFSSIAMAHSYVDLVGKVDVITDADNIKKLLKMNYSGAPISMILHRVGRTLLIDNLDVCKNVLSSKEQELKWLRKFMSDTLNSDSNLALVPAVPLSRQDLEAHLMLSKFLYHSLDTSKDNSPDTNHGDFYDEKSQSNVPDPLLSDTDALGSSNNFERNVLWNFEDIRMLIGTDLPIFGAGTHPCVTLRLKDMKRPISVLTGIDYWLDQLMCTVPEVVMCYHLNGIVQRYEIIKTEDLPYLPESSFSPELIRDVAQNILSFLKSNATKEGHTYWLFKDKDVDVVKLYDLTCVCKEYMDETDANPFTLPVAVLMYRVARNLLQYSSKSHKNLANTVYRLLTHCLKLLDAKKYPQVVGSTHYFLASLYMTCVSGSKTTPATSSSPHQTAPSCVSAAAAATTNANIDTTNKNVKVVTTDDLAAPDKNGSPEEAASSTEEIVGDVVDINNFDYYNDEWYADDTLNRLGPQQRQLNSNMNIEEGLACVSLDDLMSPTSATDSSTGVKSIGASSSSNPTTERSNSQGQQQNANNNNKQMFIPSCSNMEDCWQSALEHILKGLDSVKAFEESEVSAAANSNTSADDRQPNVANSNVPIPLRYESLSKTHNNNNGGTTSGPVAAVASSLLPLSIRYPNASGWRLNLTSLLFVKAIKTYELLSNYAFTLERYGKALRYVKLGLLCFESARKLINSMESSTNSSSSSTSNSGSESGRKNATTNTSQTLVGSLGSTLLQCKRLAQSLLPALLVLCGDIRIALSQEKTSEMDRHLKDYGAVMYRDQKIAGQATKILAESELEFGWCGEMANGIDENLKMSQKCYEKALAFLRQKVVESSNAVGSGKNVAASSSSSCSNASASTTPSKIATAGRGGVASSATRVQQQQQQQEDDDLGFVVDAVLVSKRLGNAKNCLGVYYMNLASALMAKEKGKRANDSNAEQQQQEQEKDVSTKCEGENSVMKTIQNCWHLSYSYFQEGIQIFSRINDKDNEALLNSNAGRLMRLCSSSYLHSKEQINLDEEHYMKRAIEMYQRALECVNPNSGPNRIWEAIAWELSTAYFVYAEQLQDRPPLSSRNFEDIEKEIVELMQKSLKLLEMLDNINPSKHAVYFYRISHIHHKLASLYHTCYMNKMDSTNSRKAKQLRSLIEMHYRKASEGFKENIIESPIEFIRVQIERAVFLESSIESLTVATSKLKVYSQALDSIIECRPAFMSMCRKITLEYGNPKRHRMCPAKKNGSLGYDDSSDDDEDQTGSGGTTTKAINAGETLNSCHDEIDQKREQCQLNKKSEDYYCEDGAEFDNQFIRDCKTMCTLTLRRLRDIMKSCLILIKSLNSRDDEDLKLWKECYKIALAREPTDILSLPSYVLSMLERLFEIRRNA